MAIAMPHATRAIGADARHGTGQQDSPAQALPSACFGCPLRHMGAPCGLGSGQAATGSTPLSSPRKTAAGRALVHEGDEFRHLHAVRLGTLKSCLSLPDGRSQIGGFHMAGDVVGFDGSATGRHHCTVIALEDTQSCAIAYLPLVERAASTSPLTRLLHHLLSREISRGQWQLLLLGRLDAQERLATFLLDMSQRALMRGCSPSEFRLPMTRRELGSYLGLSLETVSRTLSAFKKQRHLEVDSRLIRFTDLNRFTQLFKLQRR